MVGMKCLRNHSKNVPRAFPWIQTHDSAKAPWLCKELKHFRNFLTARTIELKWLIISIYPFEIISNLFWVLQGKACSTSQRWSFQYTTWLLKQTSSVWQQLHGLIQCLSWCSEILRDFYSLGNKSSLWNDWKAFHNPIAWCDTTQFLLQPWSHAE